MLCKSLHIDAQGFVLPNFVTIFKSLIDRNEEVLNFFIVNLEHRHIDLILFIFILVTRNPLENLLARDRDDSLIGSVADHGVRFSSSSLAVCEEAAVISFPRIG